MDAPAAPGRAWLSRFSRSLKHWQFIGVFSLIAGLLLLGSGGNFLRADGLEDGDPAVNALAIRDAIEWKQIHGNYSRWGFAHPGPAFFYWEGAWEWVLCDLTGLAVSPMGAHFWGIVVLNSALLAMAIVLLSRQIQNPAFVPAACAVAAIHFCMVNRGLPCAAMLSIWPPYVLLAPFTLFIVASGSLAGGSISALPWVVGAGGLLVHGHAAHGMFVLPVFFVAAAMWTWHERVSPWKASGGRTAVVSATIMLAVFLIPLVIDAAQGAESNLAAIWQQLHTQPQQAPRKWLKALLYLFSFYGYITNQEQVIEVLSDKTEDAFRASAPALAVWALVHAGLIVFWFWRRRAISARTIRATVAMLFLALVLTLVWGKIQVGLLENFNAFYVHGLTLAAGWLALGIVVNQLPRSPSLWGPAWALLLLSVILCRPWLTRDFGVDPKLREEVECVARPFAGTSGPVAVSFRNDDWPEAAAVVLGMFRAGVDVRVGEEWRFMFGSRHAMPPGTDPVDVLYVQRAEAGGTVEKFRNSHGFRHEAPTLTSGYNEIGVGGTPLHPFLVSGLAIAGPNAEVPSQGVSISRTVRLRFRLPAGARTAEFSLGIRSQNNPLTHAGQRVIVFLEGNIVADAFVNGDAQITFAADIPLAEADTPIDIRIELPDAWQPRELRLSADYRRFALLVNSIEIRVDGGESRAP